MRLSLPRILTIGCLMAVIPAVGTASTTTTITTLAQGAVYSFNVSDPRGPATSGTLLSALDFFEGRDLTFTPPARVRAAQDTQGRSGVSAEGVYPEPSGSPGNSLFATASCVSEVVNDTPEPRHYVYRFSISPPTLTLAEYGPGGLDPSSPGAPWSEYEIEVRVDGVPVFQSGAVLVGGRGGHQLLKSGTDLGGTFFSSSPQVFGYTFSPYAAPLELGVRPPHNRFIVETVVSATARAGAAEAGGAAAIGDPLDLSGDPGVSGAIRDEVATGTDQRSQLPPTFAVRLAAPNPVRERAMIVFELPAATRVSLGVYDVRGRRLRTLLDGEMVPAGQHAVEWDRHGADGARLPAGVYFQRFWSPRFSRTLRLVAVD